MSIADDIPNVMAARAARQAERNDERSARDAFIQAQFPLMAERFEVLLQEALGVHSQLNVQITPVVLPVQGRNFAALPIRVVRVRSMLAADAQTVTFTPQLDFRGADQFGRLICTIDFNFAPRPNRNDLVALALLNQGIGICGSTVARLQRPSVPSDRGDKDLSRADLEAAFSAWWLR